MELLANSGATLAIEYEAPCQLLLLAGPERFAIGSDGLTPALPVAVHRLLRKANSFRLE